MDSRSVDERELPARLGRNIKHLRGARGLTQEQMSKTSGLPRATWANLESGTAKPTLAVLHRVALALQAPIEVLIGTPRSTRASTRRINSRCECV